MFKEFQRTMSFLLALSLLFVMLPNIILTTDASQSEYAPYPTIEYGYSSSVKYGTIRYISQITSSSYFTWNYWPTSSFGGYASPGTECGTASISMALSYVGINETPKHLLESTNGYTAKMWKTYENTICSSLGTSASAISAAMDNYINGNGKYSPLVIQMTPYPTSGNQHFVILAGKIADNKYFVIDPARSTGWTMTISGSSASLSWTSGTYPITSVHQWYNPNAYISNDVTVTFNANGGTCATEERSVTNGAAVGTLPYPVREGYYFDGWYTAASGGTEISDSTVITGNTTFYAHWSNDYEDLGSGFCATIGHPSSGYGIAVNGDNVELGTYGNTESVWYFERYAEGCYAIQNMANGKMLDVANADTADKTNIWTYQRNDTNAQKWFIHDNGTGYTLIAKDTGKALDVGNGANSIGCNVQLFSRSRTASVYQTVSFTDAYPVYFDANGGSNAPDTQWKTHDVILTIPSDTPVRSGVAFLGWATSSTAEEAEYQPGDSFTLNKETTLYAVWSCAHSYESEIIPATCEDYEKVRYTCTECGESYTAYAAAAYSEWSETYPDGVAEHAIETKTEYRYSDYETTTSYDPNLSGWERLGSNWEEVSAGAIEHVKNWPAGFSTSNSLYSQYNQSIKSAYESETNKTVIHSDFICGYLYYHWCRNTYSAGPINRTTKSTQQGEYGTFHAFYSTTSPDSLTAASDGDGSYQHSNASCCKDSYWYFYVPVYIQYHTNYQNLFTYGRWSDWSDWSETEFAATDSRIVETRTLYRYISGVTEWTETYPEDTEEALVQSKTQYRYSDQETTTSYSASRDAL